MKLSRATSFVSSLFLAVGAACVGPLGADVDDTMTVTSSEHDVEPTGDVEPETGALSSTSDTGRASTDSDGTAEASTTGEVDETRGTGEDTETVTSEGSTASGGGTSSESASSDVTSSDVTSSDVTSSDGTSSDGTTSDGTSSDGTSSDGTTSDDGGTQGATDDGGSGGETSTAIPDGCGDLGDGRELLALGHSGSPTVIAATPTRVLGSENSDWILWDKVTREPIARGRGHAVAHGGDAFVVDNLAGSVGRFEMHHDFELRSLDDGSLLGEAITEHWEIGIARDGSYVWTHDGATLSLWEPDGSLRAEVATDLGATALALPDEWLTPGGDGRIHRVDTGDGTVTLDAPFAGTFRAFFVDGTHYLTELAGVVFVYSSAGGSAVGVHDIGTGDQWGGVGERFWRWRLAPYVLEVFEIGDDTPVLAVPSSCCLIQLGGSASALALVRYGVHEIQLVDLEAEVLAAREIVLPTPYHTGFAGSNTDWVVSGPRGTLWSGRIVDDEVELHAMGPGGVVALAGGANGLVAAATQTGGVRVFDVSSGDEVTAIDRMVSELDMRADGLVLAMQATLLYSQYSPDRTVEVVSLPDGAVLHSFPDDVTLPATRGFDMASDGSVIARAIEHDTTAHVIELTELAGGTVIYEADTTARERVLVASGGTAITRTTLSNNVPPTPIVTRFIVDGALTNIAAGRALAYVGPDELLFDAGGATFERRTSAGAFIASTVIPVPYVATIAMAEDGSVYVPRQHRRYDLAANAELPWDSKVAKSGDAGTVAGDMIVHVTCNGQRLVAMPY